MNDFKIFCPTYKRAGAVITHKYLPDIKYVVAESEAEAYEKTGVPMWVVPDSAQGNLCRIRNYILDNADTDKILLLDDDLRKFGRWKNGKQWGKLKLTKDRRWTQK